MESLPRLSLIHIFKTECPEIQNELGEIARMFFHEAVSYDPGEEETITINHRLTRTTQGMRHDAVAEMDGQTANGSAMQIALADGLIGKRYRKYAAKQAVYRALAELTGRTMPWGGLTGVRPVKMLAQLEEMGLPPAKTLREQFDVSEERVALCQRIAKVQSQMQVRKSDVCVRCV